MAFSVVAHTSQGASGGSSPVTTGSIDTTGANLLVVGVGSLLGTSTGITDSKGNTYTQVAILNTFGNDPWAALYYCANPIVGTGHTFTLTDTTNPTGCYASLAVIALSGADTVSPLDQDDTGASHSSPIPLNSITPTTNDQVVIVTGCIGSVGQSVTFSGGFTEDEDLPGVGGNSYGVFLAHLIQTTAAAAAPSVTSSGGGGSAVIASFKAASAPAGPAGTLATTEATDTAAFSGTVVPIQTIPANPVLITGHSLVSNLLACYLPGVYGGVPVSNVGPVLSDGAGGAGTIVSTIEGPASQSSTLGSARGLTATAPSAFKTWTNFTVYWRGLVIGAMDNFCPLVGVSSTDADVAPFFMLNVAGSTTGYANITSFYGDSSTSETTSATDVTSLFGQIVDFAATATVGGVVTFYVNGVSIGTGSLTTISTSDATAKIVVNQGIDATSRSPNASVNMACFWDRALSPAEIASLNTGAYQFLESGLGAIEQKAFPRTTRGKKYTNRFNIRPALYTPPDYPAAAAIDGSFAPTEAADVAAFSGSVFWDGSFAATDAPDAAAFNGVVAWLASLATTDAADVSSFTATGSPFWAGSLVVTDTKDVAAFSGDAILSASLVTTEAADVASFVASGVATTGSFAVTDAPDVASFTGTGPFWSGTLVATDLADVATFTATGPFWTGSLAATDAKDVMAFTGTGPIWSGSFAATDTADAAAFSGSIVVGNAGSLAATDAPDVAAFTAVGPLWTGLLATTDAPDSAAFTGLVSLAGQLVATDTADIVSFITLPPVTGTLAAIDPPDTCRFVGQMIAEVGVLNFGWPRVKVRRRL